MNFPLLINIFCDHLNVQSENKAYPRCRVIYLEQSMQLLFNFKCNFNVVYVFLASMKKACLICIYIYICIEFLYIFKLLFYLKHDLFRHSVLLTMQSLSENFFLRISSDISVHGIEA